MLLEQLSQQSSFDGGGYGDAGKPRTPDPGSRRALVRSGELSGLEIAMVANNIGILQKMGSRNSS
jgi:hypothetical protein